MTLAHSPGTTPAQPLRAMAPPVMPAMRAWLLEQGMPKNQQNTPQAIDPIIDATSASNAMWVSPEKSTMLNMVCATEVEMKVMPMRPTKLKTAATMRATVGRMQRVATAVAMALGASVAPETMVTPMTRMSTTASRGCVPTSSKVAISERFIQSLVPI